MLQSSFLRKLCVVLILLLGGCGGCARHDTSKSVTFEQEESEYTLLIVADIDVIQSNPRAFEFVTYAVEHYFKERVGTHDQIIISGLSGNKRPLLFQGTPRDLRREMPTEEAFRKYLTAHSEQGRRINDGIAESLDYVAHTSSVKRGKAAPIALIVSSMVDGEPESKESDERVMAELIKFGKAGGQMAFYFCDQQRMAAVREKMEKAGFGWEILECDIHGRPPLPSYNR